MPTKEDFIKEIQELIMDAKSHDAEYVDIVS